VVEGNPDGTYKPSALLNRAEFVKIVMGLVPNDGTPFGYNCFPDVPSSIWFAGPVCRARALGIVNGNAIAGVPQDKWPFAATRNVNFAEAVKILVEIFDIPFRAQNAGEEWFVRYFEAALPVLGSDTRFNLNGADTSSVRLAGTFITRAEMARLTVDFIAHDEGELAEYWAAEDGTAVSSKSSSETSSSTSISTSSSSSSSSSRVSVVYDPDSDVSQRANFLQLGDTATPVLAAVKVFSDSEPLNLNTISITLSASVTSIDSLMVYDEFARFIGRAYRKSGNTYELSVKNADITIPYREDYSFYIRAQLKAFTVGGVSGEEFRVSSVTVKGDGSWSNRAYTKASADTFPTFETTRSIITDIDNAGAFEEPLVSGSGIVIGAYRFEGESGDGGADLTVTKIEFKLSIIGGVSVSDVEIVRQGIDIQHSCSVSSTTVTCSNIPDYIASFEDGPVILELYADIVIPSTSTRSALGANINQPGSTSSVGSVTWTDGSTSFTWVPFGSPVARGTYYEQ